MEALAPGKSAPDFALDSLDGKKFSLQDALDRGPVVAAFFKVSCPTCQYTFPYLERLYKAYGNKNVILVGVSQNDKKDTAAFVREYGITFPILLDDIRTYSVSNAFGLTNVPTIFWIASDGEIEESIVGWSRRDIEELGRRMGEENGTTNQPLFQPGEDVPDFRAG